jgi:hypothetical protein
MSSSQSLNRVNPQIFMNRLEMLESNLLRVWNQHEALIPLLDLVELLPHVQKNFEQGRQVKQRLDNLSHNIQEFMTTLKQNITHGTLSSIEKTFNSANSQIHELKQKTKDIEGSIHTEAKVNMHRLKD